jgi:hypothetical protein
MKARKKLIEPFELGFHLFLMPETLKVEAGTRRVGG